MRISFICALTGAVAVFPLSLAFAADNQYYGEDQSYSGYETPYQTPGTSVPRKHFLSGDWSLTLGGEIFRAPRLEGTKDYIFNVAPIIDLGRFGEMTRFSSRNDSASFAFYDTKLLSAGLVGKILLSEDRGDAIRGLDSTKWGGEIGGFAELYPTDNLRIRGELRQGIRAHSGLIGDVAVDVFQDVTPTVRVSAGPRLSYATKDYFRSYYGVNKEESIDSGLSEYKPGGGLRAIGLGGAVNWQATEKIGTGVFAEYEYLMGPAKNSSIVREKGSRNQWKLGVSATYRFDFTID